MEKNTKIILLGFLINVILGFGLFLLCLYSGKMMLLTVPLSLMITGYFFGWFWQKTSLSLWQKVFLSFWSIVFNSIIFWGIHSIIYPPYLGAFQMTFLFSFVSFILFLLCSPCLILGHTLYLKTETFFLKY